MNKKYKKAKNLQVPKHHASQSANRVHEHFTHSPTSQVLSLQRTLGNQAVQRLFESGTIQAKLKIGQPNDKYEQEADRVSDEVMRMPEPKEKNTSQGKTNTDQTKSGLLAGNSEISIQRQEDILQAKASPGYTPQMTQNAAANIQNLRGGGQPLPANQRRFFESRMGQDFSGVRIHTDSKAADTAQTIQAKAFTLGNDIVFNSGQYSHDNQGGTKLLAHELTHVVQQNGGAAVGLKRTPTPFTPKVNHRTEIGIARSVDDWTNTSSNITDVARSMTYSQLVNDIDAITEWLNRQTTSTIESAQLEEVLKGLILEERLQKAKALDKRRRRRKLRRDAKKMKDPESELPQPRILREHTSVQYENAEEINQEIDLIMAWLARKDTKADERSILKQELKTLAPQFQQGRAQASSERYSTRLKGVFTASEDSGFTSLQQLGYVIKGLHQIPKDPKDPKVFLIFHKGEQIPISEQQVIKLKSDVAREYSRGVNRTNRKIDSGFNRYSAQAAINRESLAIAFISDALGDVDDPFNAMLHNAEIARKNLAALKNALAVGDYPEAARYLAQAEGWANRIEDAGIAFGEGHISGAGSAVEGLTITRNVSFAIAGSLAAVAAAPLVVAGAAGAASGLGLSGGAALAFTTTGTAVGTGAIVGTGSAVVQGTSAGAGELFSGGSVDQILDATYKGAKKGGKEGLVTGLTGGAAQGFGTVFKVGKQGIGIVNQTARKAGAEATADLIGGTTAAALDGAGIKDSLLSGTQSAVLGVPGSVVGAGFKNKAARETVETLVGGGTAVGGTYLAGERDTGKLIQAGAISLTSKLVTGRATPKQNTGGQKRAFAFGESLGAKTKQQVKSASEAAGSRVESVKRKIRSTSAAILIGASEPIPAFRMHNTSADLSTNNGQNNQARVVPQSQVTTISQSAHADSSSREYEFAPRTQKAQEQTADTISNRNELGHSTEVAPITRREISVTDTLVGSSRDGMRRDAARLINDTPDHSLKFLLKPDGKLKSAHRTKHHEMIDNPDLLEMGHVVSHKSGQTEHLVLQSGWTNQFDNKTVEGIRGAGAFIQNEAISIGGVGVEMRTAYDWVEAGFIDKSVVDNAPRILFD